MANALVAQFNAAVAGIYASILPIAQNLPCVAGGAFDTLLQDTFTAAHLATHPPRYVPAW